MLKSLGVQYLNAPYYPAQERIKIQITYRGTNNKNQASELGTEMITDLEQKKPLSQEKTLIVPQRNVIHIDT